MECKLLNFYFILSVSFCSYKNCEPTELKSLHLAEGFNSMYKSFKGPLKILIEEANHWFTSISTDSIDVKNIHGTWDLLWTASRDLFCCYECIKVYKSYFWKPSKSLLLGFSINPKQIIFTKEHKTLLH